MWVILPWVFAYANCLKHTCMRMCAQTHTHTHPFYKWRTESGNNVQSLNYIAPKANLKKKHWNHKVTCFDYTQTYCVMAGSNVFGLTNVNQSVL